MKLALIARFLLRNSVRASVSAAGFGLVGIGILLLFLPGPGLLVILGGLGVLATQFAWAARARDAIKASAVRARDAAMARSRRGTPPGTGRRA